MCCGLIPWLFFGVASESHKQLGNKVYGAGLSPGLAKED